MHESTPVFTISNLSCTFGQGRKKTTALDKISFSISTGEIISIVGESGSGKSTLGRILLQLLSPGSGTILFNGKAFPPCREYYRQVQMVFQNPYACFNQFFTVTAQLIDCLHVSGQKCSSEQKHMRIKESLQMVSIDPRQVEGKYPFELSGGQMQRLLLARIFLIKPSVLVADEMTSMIDACSRRSILDCLLSLKSELDMTIIFITHDISLAAKTSDRLIIMKSGRIIEEGLTERIIRSPVEDYTKNLLEHASMALLPVSASP